ncbi:MAG: hypothetical protein K1060chlam1_01034 [Candidatus Anoxychlamydiales bacterium]|nr:hypothetical protein [Candidatus Anoxychlamydiales bacterium]
MTAAATAAKGRPPLAEQSKGPPKYVDREARRRNANAMKVLTVAVTVISICALSYFGLHTIGGASGIMFTGFGSGAVSFAGGHQYFSRFEEWDKGNIKRKDFVILGGIAAAAALPFVISHVASLHIGYYIGGTVASFVGSGMGFGAAALHKKYLSKREVSDEDLRQHYLGHYTQIKQGLRRDNPIATEANRMIVLLTTPSTAKEAVAELKAQRSERAKESNPTVFNLLREADEKEEADGAASSADDSGDDSSE